MQRFFAIVGAGMLGVIALWLALVWSAPQSPTRPPAEESRQGSTANVPPKLRDVTVDPAPATVPKIAPPAAVPKIDTRAPTGAPAPVSAAPPPAPPQPQAAPSPEVPADEQAATAGPTEGDAAPIRPGTRFPKGSAGCSGYKTYNPQTQTYRGYDGIVRPCRPI